VVPHTDLFHDAQRCDVRRVGAGEDLSEIGLAKRPGEQSEGRLRRVAASPQKGVDPVKDLDVFSGLHETEPAETDQLCTPFLANSPETEAVAFERVDSRTHDLFGLLAGDDFAVPEESSDVSVGPELVKDRQVLEGPRPKLQPLGLDG
jgi:hypothetical protein